MATVVAVPHNAEASIVELVAQGFSCCGCRENVVQRLNKRPPLIFLDYELKEPTSPLICTTCLRRSRKVIFIIFL